MRWVLQATLTDAAYHLPGSPYVHAIEAPDHETLDYELAPNDAWVDLPLTRLGVLQGLVLFAAPARPIQVRLYQQMDGVIEVRAGGVLIVWDTHIILQTLAPIQLRYPPEYVDWARIRAIAVGIGHEAPV